MGENYYDILGIPRSASIHEIKIAFRKLALLYHPDKNPETKDLFVKILRAYEVLSDPVLREKYDKGIFISYTTHSTTRKKADKWEVAPEDEKRRKYYKEYFERLKKELEKEQQKHEAETKSYNEKMQWFWALVVCTLLFYLILKIYQPH